MHPVIQAAVRQRGGVVEQRYRRRRQRRRSSSGSQGRRQRGLSTGSRVHDLVQHAVAQFRRRDVTAVAKREATKASLRFVRMGQPDVKAQMSVVNCGPGDLDYPPTRGPRRPLHGLTPVATRSVVEA